MRILDGDAVRAACSPAEAVRAITAALRGGLDPGVDPARHGVAVGAGQFLFMPSENARHAGTKVVTIAPGNAARGLPRIQATYLLYDAGTLELRAVLDGTALTTLRTPAVSVAAVLPRLGDELRVAVFGSGPQAYGHVATLGAFRQLTSVTHIVRDPSRVKGAVGLGSAAAEEVLRGADVVVCATSARTPLFASELIKDSAVVVAVGSHEPDAREVPGELCARATVVVEDVATALREAGDVVRAIGEGFLKPADLVPMSEFSAGPLDRPLFFKSVGMSWQDLVVAEAVIA
ncbi:ornithine cyclodeaminase family protein [Actinoplanes sp. HUAS TT8]|uniref:ornithine cyclodeaminase family protein n=1 Tax=Actinoplanes sp. HUAS TT8 TaxID=3447453 RepID=UPI003F528BA6